MKALEIVLVIAAYLVLVANSVFLIEKFETERTKKRKDAKRAIKLYKDFWKYCRGQKNCIGCPLNRDGSQCFILYLNYLSKYGKEAGK